VARPWRSAPAVAGPMPHPLFWRLALGVWDFAAASGGRREPEFRIQNPESRTQHSEPSRFLSSFPWRDRLRPVRNGGLARAGRENGRHGGRPSTKARPERKRKFKRKRKISGAIRSQLRALSYQLPAPPSCLLNSGFWILNPALRPPSPNAEAPPLRASAPSRFAPAFPPAASPTRENEKENEKEKDKDPRTDAHPAPCSQLRAPDSRLPTPDSRILNSAFRPPSPKSKAPASRLRAFAFRSRISSGRIPDPRERERERERER
jgi:hypothetical protein